jgi:purine-nucleoside phosphorylase
MIVADLCSLVYKLLMEYLNQIKACTAHIRTFTDFAPDCGIILGTGLGKLAEEIEVIASFEYADLPHFPVSTVETHKGRLIFGLLENRKVVVMQGRFHFYEGYSMKQVTFPVRVMKMLGVKCLYISNISGGINTNYQLGDMVAIQDHINLQSENPLTGENLDEMGVRFPDMLEPYDQQLIKQAKVIAAHANYILHEGVYASVPGPNLETRAEYKYLGIIGADCVGMSTVPEVIVARHMNIPCLALSIITDLCYEPHIKKADIREIIQVADVGQPKLIYMIKQLLKNGTYIAE